MLRLKFWENMEINVAEARSFGFCFNSIRGWFCLMMGPHAMSTVAALRVWLYKMWLLPLTIKMYSNAALQQYRYAACVEILGLHFKILVDQRFEQLCQVMINWFSHSVLFRQDLLCSSLQPDMLFFCAALCTVVQLYLKQKCKDSSHKMCISK